MPEATSTGDGVYAAVDLGSNSFHMLVARESGRDLELIDRLRERVALARGLDESGWLDDATQERALACLETFGQRLREVPSANVRAVGTNTFRAAANARDFRARAQGALGHPIEVVSGLEEARLVYLGVAHDLGDVEGLRLVVDIGGGSTEVILGEGLTPVQADSLYMGHAGFTNRFFADGRITAKRMEKARRAAAVELEPVERAYRRRGWATAVGSSGTALAVDAILRASDLGPAGIDGGALAALERALLDAGDAARLELPALKEDRRPTLAAGVAILQAIVHALRVERLDVSDWALREGVLYDLVGRHHEEDVRERTVERWTSRYGVDGEQAARVEATAVGLYDQVGDDWSLGVADGRRFLAWAARLHEVGMAVAYTGNHKHGAYLIENADLPGFSRDGQARLAALVRSYRRRLQRDVFEPLLDEHVLPTLRLALLLRLAVALHRSRSERALPAVSLAVRGTTATLTVPGDWLDRHPLTLEDLSAEQRWWRGVRYRLEIERGPDADG